MKRIFLMGYMGAGKTTVGKKLSKQLNLSFIDLDYYIEGRYHKEIRQLLQKRRGGFSGYRTADAA